MTLRKAAESFAESTKAWPRSLKTEYLDPDVVVREKKLRARVAKLEGAEATAAVRRPLSLSPRRLLDQSRMTGWPLRHLGGGGPACANG